MRPRSCRVNLAAEPVAAFFSPSFSSSKHQLRIFKILFFSNYVSFIIRRSVFVLQRNTLGVLFFFLFCSSHGCFRIDSETWTGLVDPNKRKSERLILEIFWCLFLFYFVWIISGYTTKASFVRVSENPRYSKLRIPRNLYRKNNKGSS